MLALDSVRLNDIGFPMGGMGNAAHQFQPSGTPRCNDDSHLIDLLAESVVNDQRNDVVGLARVPFASARHSASTDHIWAGW